MQFLPGPGFRSIAVWIDGFIWSVLILTRKSYFGCSCVHENMMLAHSGHGQSQRQFVKFIALDAEDERPAVESCGKIIKVKTLALYFRAAEIISCAKV